MAVLSVIHTRTERGEELRESSPQRSHPCIVITVRRPGQGESKGPVRFGSPGFSGAGRVGEVHIRHFLAIKQRKRVATVKPEKNSIFLKKGKMVILVETRKFSRSRMMKQTTPLNSSREI